MKKNLNISFLTVIPSLTIALVSCSKEEKRPNILFAIGDDMSFGHTSFDGFPEVKTSAFDKIASEGIYFSHAYVSSPSSSPSRASVLTGRNGFELEEGAVLFSYLPQKFEVYPEILAANGYWTGHTGKGWGPGELGPADRTENPAGPIFNKINMPHNYPFGTVTGLRNTDYYKNFRQFMKARPEGKPFCFWYGSSEPHRPYQEGVGKLSGKDPGKITVPGFMPDNDSVRNDILDYLFEIEWYDSQMMNIVNYLDSIGELDNTIVVMTGDNGMPFPRAKSNLYEYGTHMPLAVRWGKNKPRRVDDFISFTDFAPTFLEAAGVTVPETMSGKSFLNILKSGKSGQVDPDRNSVLIYKERHAWVQADGRCTPHRGYRKDNWLLIWNLEPDMWPAGDEDPEINFTLWPFGDVDDGPAKDEVMKTKGKTSPVDYFQLCFGKRPELELYDVAIDPFQLNNLAGKSEYTEVLSSLKEEMTSKFIKYGDPRLSNSGTEHFENAPYFGVKSAESGWLTQINWDKLSPEEKGKNLTLKKNLLQKNLRRLKEVYNH